MPPRLEQFSSKAAFDAAVDNDNDCCVSSIAGRSMTMREAANFKIKTTAPASNNNDNLTMRKAANIPKPPPACGGDTDDENSVPEVKPITMRQAAALKHQEKKAKKKASRETVVMAYAIE